MGLFSKKGSTNPRKMIGGFTVADKGKQSGGRMEWTAPKSGGSWRSKTRRPTQ